MLRPTLQLRQSQRGVTLIELMIALVVGLIISGAALALVAAIIKSNSDTVRSTRLTQELRATAEVIARDLRRARSDTDPISNVGTTPLLTACNTIDTTTTGCVTYGFDCSGSAAGSFRAVDLVTSSSIGKIRLLTATAGAPACPTSATGTQISSDAVNITALTFTKVGTDAVTISLTGKLADELSSSLSNRATRASLTRSITQEVRIRSPQVQ